MEQDFGFEVVRYEDVALPASELAAINAWLKPTDYDGPASEYRRHLSARITKTGIWLQETEQYQKWLRSDSCGSLWVQGAPGSGKSVLSASLVHDLRRTEGTDAHILYFFSRHIIEGNRYPINMMRDWLAQLLPHSIAVQGKLHALAEHRSLADVSEDELWQALIAGLAKVKQAYCIIDALDEMDTTNKSFFRSLNELAFFRPRTVKLLVTSRSRPDLQSNLRLSTVVHISLEQERVGKEVELLVLNCLDDIGVNQELRQSLAETITSQSWGLFLYAQILSNEVMPAIKNGNAPDLKNLPSNILEMVCQTLPNHHVLV